MKTNFLVFKGAPRWRDPFLWLVIVIYGGLVAWNFFRNGQLWSPSLLFWTPFYGMMLVKPRLFLGNNWLFRMGDSWVSWGFYFFESIENYQFSDCNEKGGNVSVALTLLRNESPKSLMIVVSIQEGAQLDAFLAEMQARGVPALEKDVSRPLADVLGENAIFSPPYDNPEDEREALYRFINRPLPPN